MSLCDNNGFSACSKADGLLTLYLNLLSLLESLQDVPHGLGVS